MKARRLRHRALLTNSTPTQQRTTICFKYSPPANACLWVIARSPSTWRVWTKSKKWTQTMHFSAKTRKTAKTFTLCRTRAKVIRVKMRSSRIQLKAWAPTRVRAVASWRLSRANWCSASWECHSAGNGAIIWKHLKTLVSLQCSIYSVVTKSEIIIYWCYAFEILTRSLALIWRIFIKIASTKLNSYSLSKYMGIENVVHHKWPFVG